MALKTTIGNVPLRNTTKPIKDPKTEKALRGALATNDLATIPVKPPRININSIVTKPNGLDVKA